MASEISGIDVIFAEVVKGRGGVFGICVRTPSRLEDPNKAGGDVEEGREGRWGCKETSSFAAFPLAKPRRFLEPILPPAVDSGFLLLEAIRWPPVLLPPALLYIPPIPHSSPLAKVPFFSHCPLWISILVSTLSAPSLTFCPESVKLVPWAVSRRAFGAWMKVEASDGEEEKRSGTKRNGERLVRGRRCRRRNRWRVTAIQRLFLACKSVFKGPGTVPESADVEMLHFLLGSMHIKSYDWLDPVTSSFSTPSAKLRLAKLVLDSEFTAPCNTSILYPTAGGNIHTFTAITPCAVLDVLGPPYSKEDDHDITYYQDHPYRKYSDGDTDQGGVEDHCHGWLEEIDVSRYLKMDGVAYLGPQVVDG
ncbi:2-aminoethanethiol dioxygenase [Musa troglodytarum]|uniref:cysteine dioxygenase n=1 Tax=Musa troglodytarum TaxID=320322 RepID=A0A9E7KNG2_9LILI|nr:2-aminoethanethiol dioxygenase [Musa troglodytarum]